MRFEKFHEPVISRKKFYKRLLYSSLFGLIAITAAQFIGMVGYHYSEHMSWIDAFVNAAMILSGMGPLTPLKTTGGKLFAGFYALFSGLSFILFVGIIFTPLIHRFFHTLHLPDEKES